MRGADLWNAWDWTCRFLGIATTAVLLGIGAETALNGESQSLAIYLLCSGAAIGFVELSYLLDLLLCPSFFCPADSKLYEIWRRTARVGGFQKSMAYIMLSVACFLHPVLIWHVTIPGTMLVISGVAYFILSKRKKVRRNQNTSLPPEQYTNPDASAVAMMGTGDMEHTFSFKDSARPKPSLFARVKSAFRVEKGKTSLDVTGVAAGHHNPATEPAVAMRVRFQDRVLTIVPADDESLDVELEETTSDTAPIIPPVVPPTENYLLITQKMAANML
ncbi:transmembrane protein 72 [Latimeria chalumnae]|uniref:transmembrane protein 72 n=1 Tax=Latimeria chalumnae TaxID=7897 RepID=UPI0003C10A54